MSYGDDMTIRVRLRHEPTQRERAAEEKREREYEQKRERARRKWHRARAARRYAAHKMRRHGKRRLTKSKLSSLKHLKKLKHTAKFGSRAIPILGWLLLANDVAIFAHEMDRRISGGMSARLVELQDDHIVYGDMIPQAAAAATARDYVESDPARLRAIGEDGHMSSTLKSNLEIVRRLAYERAVGADMIRRDAHFDSADSLLDKLIMQAERQELKGMADRTAHLIRQRRRIGG